MTYCLGIKVREGLVALADTRITAGTSTTTKKKIFISQEQLLSLYYDQRPAVGAGQAVALFPGAH